MLKNIPKYEQSRYEKIFANFKIVLDKQKTEQVYTSERKNESKGGDLNEKHIKSRDLNEKTHQIEIFERKNASDRES